MTDLSFCDAVRVMTAFLQKEFGLQFQIRSSDRYGDASEVAILKSESFGKIIFDPGGLRSATEVVLVFSQETGIKNRWILLDVLATELGVYEQYFPLLSKQNTRAGAFRGPDSQFTALQYVVFIGARCDDILRGERPAMQRASDLVSAYSTE